MKKSKKILSILSIIAITASTFTIPITALGNTNLSDISKLNLNDHLNLTFDPDFDPDNFLISPNINKISGIINIFNSQISTSRISGKDRYETSANIVESGWGTTSSTAIIATGENFPDALCAAPLARKNNAPIILTATNALSDNAKNELSRLKVKNVFIIGGTGAVSQQTEDAIKALGINITRISGKNRYETSEKVAEYIGASSKIVLATGNDFPDALSVAPIAAMKGIPILLTDKTSMPQETQNYLDSHKADITDSYVIGGTGVISDTAITTVTNPKRLFGANRYETNKAIVNEFSNNLNSGNVYIATGKDFPDALACSALAPITDSPIILADSSSDVSIKSYLSSNADSIGSAIAVGGTGAVPEALLNNVADNYGTIILDPVITSNFKDSNLLAAVRSAINKPTGDIHKNDLKKIFSLSLDGKNITYLDGIENLTNLKYLYLGGANGNNITDISPLKGLKKLTTLVLNKNKISDISSLSSLINLNYLYLSNNQISNITPLSALSNLQYLSIYQNSIADVTTLSKLRNLFYLDLSNNKLSDITAVNKLTNLKGINLGTNTITNIDALKGLTKLTSVSVSNNQVVDITPLTGLSNLTYLYLDNNNIKDISTVSGLTNLRMLSVSNNILHDISAVKGLSNLAIIDLSYNQISTLTPLSGLSNLIGLNLKNTDITDVSAVSGLSNLITLDLSSNTISDITPLKGLTKLIDLSLGSTNIKNVSALKGLVNLTDLDLSYDTQITSIDDLFGLTNLKTLNLKNITFGILYQLVIQSKLPNCTITY
ncbi:MAG: cell wall-binding repeat-containing protein [Bacillota bacterium]|nr:cell wall-binding repeat-containing protein [Bacillota bacterium]